MGTRYKLPTPDGKFILVETRQAGQTVRDAAGNPLEVPTLRELQRLEPVEESSVKTAGRWNPVQGVMFVVGALLAAGGGWAGWHYYQSLPHELAAETVALVAGRQAMIAAATPDYVPLPEQRNLHDLPASQLYAAWRTFRDYSLDELPPARTELVDQYREGLRSKITISGVVAAVGVGLLAAAFFVGGRRTK